MALLLVVSFFSAGCSTIDSGFSELAYSPPEDAIVLRIKVREVEFTDRHPECGEECIPWSFWYRYNADVREILGGDFEGKSVEFVFLQHAEFIRAVTRDCYVVLVPASPSVSTELGVAYVAEQILSSKFKHHGATIDALRSSP